MNAMAYFQNIFSSRFKQSTHKQDGSTIYNALFRNGVIIERARRRSAPNNSMTKMERNIIKSVREVAEEEGMSKKQWQGIEMLGEREWGRVVEPMKVKARLAFYTSYGHETNPMADFYVIKSNHPSLVEGGNYSELDFIDAGIEVPPHPTYEKWVKKGRPIFRG